MRKGLIVLIIYLFSISVYSSTANNVINVQDYINAANGDVTIGIQNAIDNANPGKTVFFLKELMR